MYWLVVLVTIAAATPVAGQQPPVKYERPVPPGVTLHFKDTVSVAKRPDGSCDWGRVKLRPGQLGTSSCMGARDDSTHRRRLQRHVPAGHLHADPHRQRDLLRPPIVGSSEARTARFNVIAMAITELLNRIAALEMAPWA